MEIKEYSSLIQADQVKDAPRSGQYQYPDLVDDLTECALKLRAHAYVINSLLINLAYNGSEPADPDVMAYTGVNLSMFLEGIADKLDVMAADLQTREVHNA